MALKTGDVVPPGECTKVDTLPTTFFKNDGGVFKADRAAAIGGWTIRDKMLLASRKANYESLFLENDLQPCDIENTIKQGSPVRLKFGPEQVQPLSVPLSIRAVESEMWQFGLQGHDVRVYEGNLEFNALGTHNIPVETNMINQNDPRCAQDQLTFSASIRLWREWVSEEWQALFGEGTVTIIGPNGTVTATSGPRQGSAAIGISYPGWVCTGGNWTPTVHYGQISIQWIT